MVTKPENKIEKVAPNLPTTHLFRLQKAVPKNTPASFYQTRPTIVCYIYNFPHRFDFYNSLKRLYMYLETYDLRIIEIKQQKNLMLFILPLSSLFFFFVSLSLSWMNSFRRGSSNFRVGLLERRRGVHDNNLTRQIKVFFPFFFVCVALEPWCFEPNPSFSEKWIRLALSGLQVLRRKLSGEEEEKGDIMKGVALCLSLPPFVRGFVSLPG